MPDDTHSGHYKYELIAEEIIELIEAGTFSPGDQVPSLRDMHEQRDVSISTVLQAYYLLEARGWIEARERSGFYVRTTLPSALPEPDVSSPDIDPTRVNMRDLLTRILIIDPRNPDLVQLGAAHPDPDLIPTSQLYQAMSSVMRNLEAGAAEYDYVPGSEQLRVQIARRSVLAGCRLSPDDILITSGCQEAVHLCLRAVCQPGDTIAVESPICFDVLLCLENLGLQALEIPTHPQDGIRLDALRFALDHNPVKACLVISNFNNPLGSRIPEENKRELVRLTAERGIPLIENDIFGELYFNERRPTVAKAFDKAGMVMLCSSFSKCLAPGLRVGWVVPGQHLETVEWLKYSTSLSAPTLSEYTIAEFMASGGYDPYLRRTRREYERRVGGMSQAVRRYFPEECKLTRPQGGFVLWVQLPAGIDSLNLYNMALKARIAITPGILFSPTDQYRAFIRLNAAKWTDDVDQAIRVLGQFVADLME